MRYVLKQKLWSWGDDFTAWFTWTDTCGVDISEGENDVLILASTVVIDMACHQEHKS